MRLVPNSYCNFFFPGHTSCADCLVIINKSSYICRNSLLQMIVEKLFGDKPDVVDAFTSGTDTRELTAVEENAIYYAAGYVVQKLLKKFERKDSSKAHAVFC